ncbi:MAG TPA: ribonuclease E inhibitor RraB [Myxococcaceae bacterium]|nr:ribonuclease E inhibitor RraB [Myxococcaceae bacterium]
MASSRKRARLGDLLEVSTPRGLAYVQYVGKHPKYGTAIRVLPGFFEVRPRDWSSLVAREGYFTFYPVSVAISEGAVEIVANQAIATRYELPSRFRRPGWRTKEGKVTTWLICEGARESLRTELSEEERHLFIASIWNHEFLVERLVEEWHPTQEPAVEERPAPEPARETSAEELRPGQLSHYLYFRAQKEGQAVAAELKKRGFEVESRKSADGVKWLVLATHRLESVEDFPNVRDALEQLAEQHSGEYDGWELAPR